VIPLSHDQFKRALSEALISEYEQSVPQTEPHDFSPGFEKNINKLIRRRKKPYYRLINSFGKRAACFACVILGLSVFCVLKADAIRNAFNDFMVFCQSMFSDDHPEDPDPAPTTIEEKYHVTYPFDPGFVVDYQYESDTSCSIVYRKGETIVFFDQYTKETFHVDEDTEAAERIPYSVNGKEATFFLDHLGRYHLIWDDGGYILSLMANLDEETFFDIANSVKKAE